MFAYKGGGCIRRGTVVGGTMSPVKIIKRTWE